jgi:hypothetical protein
VQLQGACRCARWVACYAELHRIALFDEHFIDGTSANQGSRNPGCRISCSSPLSGRLYRSKGPRRSYLRAESDLKLFSERGDEIRLSWQHGMRALPARRVGYI